MKFEKYIEDIETVKEIILNKGDYESEVDICMLFDLDRNISCYLELYNGELDLMINKHYNNKKDEYDNWYSIEIEPNLNSYEDLQKQLEVILNKEVVNVNK
jgi:hypothetical protein